MTTISRASRVRGLRAPTLLVLGTALVAVAGPGTGLAQTDYHNTDAGRPVRIEDAHAITTAKKPTPKTDPMTNVPGMDHGTVPETKKP